MKDYVDLEKQASASGFSPLDLARMGLSMVKGMKLSVLERMLSLFGSPEAYFTYSEGDLSARAGARLPVFDTDYRSSMLERAIKECRFDKDHNIRALWIEDKDYPRRVRECEDAPAMIFALGGLNLNPLRSIAVVGTRHATNYGVGFASKLIEEMAEILPGTTVISGLAYGIDICAHRTALKSGLPTAAILAHALDTVYPAEHRSWAVKIVESGGALLSEYPSGTPMHKGNFLARNRIVAGMSDMVLLVESDTKGGSMITARLARGYNREVGAVPGRVNDPYSRGANKLIATNVATMVRDLDDILEIMGWKPETECEKQPSLALLPEPMEKVVLDHIRIHPEHTVNEMCLALSIPYSELSALLFNMEMKDLVVSVPGGRYAPPGY